MQVSKCTAHEDLSVVWRKAAEFDHGKSRTLNSEMALGDEAKLSRIKLLDIFTVLGTPYTV